MKSEDFIHVKQSALTARSQFVLVVTNKIFTVLSIGLSMLSSYLDENDDIELVYQHVERVDLNDELDLVIIQVYII